MFCNQALEWRKDLCVKKRARLTCLPRRSPSLFQFPNHGRVFRLSPPLMTHMFRMQEIRTQCPAVCSGTEELICSPLTSQVCGAVGSTNMASLRNTQLYTIALCMVLISEFLAYLNHTFPLTALPLIYYLQNMKKLWRKSSIKGDTSVLSCKQNWNLSLDLSSHPPSPLFLNQESQENSVGYMTSPTLVSHPQIRSHLLIQPSTHMIFPAHGEPFQQYPLSFFDCHPDPKLPFGMSQKHTGPSQPITASGQVWLCISEKMTALQQTFATTLGSPRQEGPTASLQMWVLTFSKQTELAHYQNGLMIIYFLGFLTATLTHTIVSIVPGANWLHQMEGEYVRAAIYGTKVTQCLMDAQKNLMKIWPPPYAISPTPPHVPHMMPYLHMLIRILTFFQMSWASHGKPHYHIWSHCPILGFVWDLDTHTVAVPVEKKLKYLNTIKEWEKKLTHALAEVQKLYGKLLHASLVVTAGHAYLTNLEAMLSGFNNSPFMPHTPPRNTSNNLKWWADRLQFPTLSRSVPGPVPLTDLNAFSDASSGFGIGITIGNKWHAWHLLPGWKSDGQDIGWAEAVGFKLLSLRTFHISRVQTAADPLIHLSTLLVVSRLDPVRCSYDPLHNASASAALASIPLITTKMLPPQSTYNHVCSCYANSDVLLPTASLPGSSHTLPRPSSIHPVI